MTKMKQPPNRSKRWMRRIARQGGQKTLAKFGPEHFRRLAAKKKGMKYRKHQP